MKVGDVVRFSKIRIGGPVKMYGMTGIVVSKRARGTGSAPFLEVLVDGKVVIANYNDVEVINEAG